MIVGDGPAGGRLAVARGLRGLPLLPECSPARSRSSPASAAAPLRPQRRSRRTLAPGPLLPLPTPAGMPHTVPVTAQRRVPGAALAQRWIADVADTWVSPDDSDEVRTRKAAMVVASATVCVLAGAWVATYFALGLPIPASIPLLYEVVSLGTLAVLRRTQAWGWFRASQLAMMTTLPFLLQWSLGGYLASSAVSLWALVAALGAIFFSGARAAVPWFGLFLGLTLVSGLAEPALTANAAPIPHGIQVTFFVLNIAAVSLTAWLLLQFSVRAQEAAMERSEALLLNVLPASIVRRLKREPGVIAQDHAQVTVLFADVAGFTQLVERTEAASVVELLNEIFSAFDELAERHGLEKIKTIGDAYMVVVGIPEPREDHAEASAEMALAMQARLAELARARGVGLDVRIGIASGPVVAGVIGRRKFAYDVWGDTVNTASRMESQGIPGRIQVSETTWNALRDRYDFEARGEVDIKGKGPMSTWLLRGRRAPAGE